MLQERYSRDDVRRRLLPRDQWHPFPVAADRPAWERLQKGDLNRRRAAYLVGRAEGVQGRPIPPLPASLYMDYRLNGPRRPFEGPFFQRRGDLGGLVMAECFEHRGRFVGAIADRLWAICEETTWCVPAHIHHRSDPDAALDPLGRIDRHIVDLFAAQTGMVLAETAYLLGAELDAFSPLIRERVRREVLARVVDPVLDVGDFHWLEAPMNWNTWCSSNVLGSAFYLSDDADRTAALTWKLMGATDAFLAGQLPDGGCSEGPNYWGVAPGALIILLELLHARTGGKIDVYDEPLIRDLGLYLPRVHLDGPWFATFADCPPRVGVRRGAVARYGTRIGEPAMVDLALLEMRGWDPAGEIARPIQGGGTGGALTAMLREVFWIDPDATPSGADREPDVWLPDLQVMVARQTPAPGEGLVVAAKGGHNREHHNHNDVGQFIILCDGAPMIVDVGVGEYTRETFGPNRYSLWAIRGSGHNVPVVDAVEQAPGEAYAAADVAFNASEDITTLSMDLAGAYPPEAKLTALRRTIELQRGDDASVRVTDEYATDGDTGPVRVHLFTPGEADDDGAGRVTLTHDGRSLKLIYDPAAVSIAREPWPIDDSRLAAAWGRQLTRLTVTSTPDGSAGGYTLTFCP
ncbi:MAG: heparinase II/III domain-containing protein [Planctomycetota bacterium]